MGMTHGIPFKGNAGTPRSTLHNSTNATPATATARTFRAVTPGGGAVRPLRLCRWSRNTVTIE